MSKVNIYIRNDYRNRNGLYALYLRVFISKKEHYAIIPLEIYCSIENFDKEKQQIRGNGAKADNLLINEAKGKASEILLKYRVQKRQITKSQFLAEYTNPSNDCDFLLFLEREIEERYERQEIKYPTRQMHYSILQKLRTFNNNLTFSDMNAQTLDSFKKYMSKIGNNPNTIHKNLKTIKTYVRIACNRKLIENDVFKNYKLTLVKTYPKFIEENELILLWKLYNDIDTGKRKVAERYYRTLRYFLFVCNTGLRINDLCNLEMSNITERKEKKYLNFTPEKTENDSIIPLNNNALRLINDESKFRIKGKVFDCYSQAKMNEYIKIICEMAGIDKEKSRVVSFCYGRHTFASILVANGIDIVTVSKLMTHSNPNTTLTNYAHLMPGQKEKAVKLLDNEFTKN